MREGGDNGKMSENIGVMEIGGRVCVGTSVLAGIFDVDRRTITRWEKQGCPKERRGVWCLSDVIRWRDEKIQGKKDADANLEDLGLNEQKIYWEMRCREAQAENQKFKNAVLKGDYLEKGQAQKDLEAFFSVLKQAVLSVPRKAAIISAQYVGNERGREVENEVMGVMTDVLQQWSQGELDAALDQKGAAAAEAPGKINRFGVGRPEPISRRKKQQ